FVDRQKRSIAPHGEIAIYSETGYGELRLDAIVVVQHVQVSAARRTCVFDVANAMLARAFKTFEASDVIVHFGDVASLSQFSAKTSASLCLCGVARLLGHWH